MENVDLAKRYRGVEAVKVETIYDLQKAYRARAILLKFLEMPDYFAWDAIKMRIELVLGEPYSDKAIYHLQNRVAQRMKLKRSEVASQSIRVFAETCTRAFLKRRHEKCGRPQKYDASDDAQMSGAWDAYRDLAGGTYEEAAAELSAIFPRLTARTLKCAIDRHRHRRN